MIVSRRQNSSEQRKRRLIYWLLLSAKDCSVGLRSFISAIEGNEILMISPFGHSILTLGVVNACVVFMLRTMPRTRVPSVVVISTLSLPYRGRRAARALVTSTIVSASFQYSSTFDSGDVRFCTYLSLMSISPTPSEKYLADAKGGQNPRFARRDDVTTLPHPPGLGLICKASIMPEACQKTLENSG